MTWRAAYLSAQRSKEAHYAQYWISGTRVKRVKNHTKKGTDMKSKWIVTISGCLVILAFLSLISGCESLRATRSTQAAPVVSTGWEQTLGVVGLVAIWPPREDVRVGDFYVYPVNPEDSPRIDSSDPNTRRISAATRWGSIPLVPDLTEQYQRRPSLPKTPESHLQTPDPSERRAWEEPISPDQSIFASDDVTRRLRLVGLNAIPASTYSQGELNALLPAEVVNLVLGSAWEDAKAVVIKPGSAESYSLPLKLLVERLLDEATIDGRQHYFLKQQYRGHLGLASEQDVVWIQVINEVVYVRSLDIAIAAKRASRKDDELLASGLQPLPDDETIPEEAGVVQDPAPVTASSESAQASIPQPVPSTKALPANDTLDPIYGAFARAQAINRVLAGSGTGEAPGTMVRFLSVTDESVALRRVWQRGLAIGIRGLTLEVDKRNGEILRLGPMGVPLPE